MEKFNINQLAQFSGIKAHTIRMWEQRYHALQPKRTERNFRLYSNKDLKRLLNIASLLKYNYKISEISSLTDAGLSEKILIHQLTGIQTTGMEPYILQLISSGLNFDELHFEKIFSHSILRYGLKKTYMEIIFPLLDRLGIMWAGETLPPAQEHFISNLIRKKMFTAIDSLPPPKNQDSWLLFLPEDEFHELALLYAHFSILQSGAKVIYLGSNLPFSSVIDSIKSIDPKYLLLFFVHQDFPLDIKKYLEKVLKNFKGDKIYACGRASLLEDSKRLPKVDCLHSAIELEQVLIGSV